MARQKNTLAHLVAILLFLGGIVYLFMTGIAENSVYFLNVAEAKALDPAKLTQARLFGTVSENDLAIDTARHGASFVLQDKDNPEIVMPVSYNGVLPDAFKAGAEVIVEGGLGEHGNFVAKILMTQCPSKYEKGNRKV